MKGIDADVARLGVAGQDPEGVLNTTRDNLLADQSPQYNFEELDLPSAVVQAVPDESKMARWIVVEAEDTDKFDSQVGNAYSGDGRRMQQQGNRVTLSKLMICTQGDVVIAEVLDKGNNAWTSRVGKDYLVPYLQAFSLVPR